MPSGVSIDGGGEILVEVGLGDGIGPGSPIELSGTSSTPIIVANFSRSSPEQDRITDVLTMIGAALSKDTGDCARWLRGGGVTGAELVDALVSNNTYGHGKFNVETTAAVQGQRNADGTPTGIPPDSAITVNTAGAFFNRTTRSGATFSVGARGYIGGSLRAQASILIHEFAHVLGADRFKSDLGNAKAGRDNDNLVDGNCRKLIESSR